MSVPAIADEQDLRLAAAGDRAAYERLVREYAGLVTSLALSVVRDVSRSEDVAQDVFIAAWRDLRRLRNPRSFLPWLRQMTRNLAFRTLRDRHVPAEDGALERADPQAQAAADRLERDERERALSEALAELEVDDREVLLLYYREGQSVRQVARLLELSEPATRKRLSRARARLRVETDRRLADAAAATAPGPRFTAGVIAAVQGLAPGAAAGASGALKAGLVGKLGALGLVGLGVGSALAAIWVGARNLAARARDDRERAGAKRYRLAGTAAVLVAAVLMFGAPELGISRRGQIAVWAAYVLAIDWLALFYVPKVIARREAAERAEDPGAAARQRRQRRVRYAAALLVNLGSVAGIIWVLRR